MVGGHGEADFSLQTWRNLAKGEGGGGQLVSLNILTKEAGDDTASTKGVLDLLQKDLERRKDRKNLALALQKGL